MGEPPSREGSYSSFPNSDDDEPETSGSERGAGGGGEDAHRPLPLRQQLVGACRADDRLRPLLTLNVSCSAAENRFISHLSQHFEVSEVGMLARCLCVPLVSLRVGKVDRHGPLLCPTTIRGKLSLGLLPSSSMRLTFSGDDGCSEELALLNDGLEVSEAVIEEISADNSGRSFLVRISESKRLYYWCAEKSKECGMELLAKMKNLLQGRPTLSDLTGISNSRLDAFVTNLHAYLLAPSIGDAKLLGSSTGFLSNSSSQGQHLQPPSVVSRSSRSRTSAANATKASSIYQASLSPRSSTFKDGVPRTSCAKVVGREKLKRRGDWLGPSTALIDANPLIAKSVKPDSTSEVCDRDCSKNSVTPASSLDLPLSFPLLPPLYPLPEEGYSENPFKPYYCWCPPCPSSLQYSVTPLHMPVTSVEPFPQSPLGSLVSNEVSSVSSFSAKLDTTNSPSLNLPSILHDPSLHLQLPTSIVPLHGSMVSTYPLLHLPFPTSPLVPVHGSQVPTFPLLHLPLPTSPFVSLHSSQVPTFTPLMSDPIVHVPVIDMCSSGQAYLVSCGPSITSPVPLLPSLKPLIPETESLVERSARETLMRLLASTPPSSNPQLVNILPAVLTDVPENISRSPNVNMHVGVHRNDLLLSSSWGANVIGSGMAAMELHSEDEVSSGHDAHAMVAFTEFDDINGDCDQPLFRRM
ncbi:unnamed protein product [Triticum aestivum]|nr:uncharacterized protein LOC109771472 isoform X1 [Aegilops tauschii subsp. strangulata]XP_044332303.1 uncharacterized protein LOC123052998 isoform X1 [Triticum aestivum]KAF7016077.1 hypothetical protein CFC21_029768 [Triticum aestivum]SPT18037.1 unnamed protein product [Triticum aestivum]